MNKEDLIETLNEVFIGSMITGGLLMIYLNLSSISIGLGVHLILIGLLYGLYLRQKRWNQIHQREMDIVAKIAERKVK